MDDRLQAMIAERNRSVAGRGRGKRPSLKETLVGTLGMGAAMYFGPDAATQIFDRLGGGPPVDPRTINPLIIGGLRIPRGQLINRDVPSTRQMAPVRRAEPVRRSVRPEHPTQILKQIERDNARIVTEKLAQIILREARPRRGGR